MAKAKADKPLVVGNVVFGTTLKEDNPAHPVAVQIAKSVRELMLFQRLVVAMPCTMHENKKDANGEETWRQISMVGKEELEVIDVYYGKRDGVILKMKPLTVPLGLKADDLPNLTFELSLRKHGFLQMADGQNIGAFLDRVMPLNEPLEDAVTVMRRRAEEAERERLRKEAAAKFDNYGSNWGAF